MKHIWMMNIMLNSVESWSTTWFVRNLGIDKNLGIDNVWKILEALQELGELSGVALMDIRIHKAGVAEKRGCNSTCRTSRSR